MREMTDARAQKGRSASRSASQPAPTGLRALHARNPAHKHTSRLSFLHARDMTAFSAKRSGKERRKRNARMPPAGQPEHTNASNSRTADRAHRCYQID